MSNLNHKYCQFDGSKKNEIKPKYGKNNSMRWFSFMPKLQLKLWLWWSTVEPKEKQQNQLKLIRRNKWRKKWTASRLSWSIFEEGEPTASHKL